MRAHFAAAAATYNPAPKARGEVKVDVRRLSMPSSLSPRHDAGRPIRTTAFPRKSTGGILVKSTSDSGSMNSERSSGRKSNGDPLAQHGYKLLGPIAAGSFSQVQRARHNASGVEVAVKSFNKAKYQKAPHLAASMRHELLTLKTLQSGRHPAIANMIQCCETSTLAHCILEYCAGGSLARKMQRNILKRVGLAEAEAGAISHQIASALQHMHTCGIAHRDIKPENILFTDGRTSRVKICDFGFAKACLDKRLKTVCGSPMYMAPEVNGREAYDAPPVDVWALGCLIFELIHAKPCYRGATLEQLAIRILRASHEPFDATVSPAAKGLVKGMLQIDPEKRLTSADTAAHDWFAACRAADASRSQPDPAPLIVEPPPPPPEGQAEGG